MIRAAILAVLVLCACTAHAADLLRLADCVAQVEAKDASQIGASGERSEYQITRAVWQQHTEIAFENASSSAPEYRRLSRAVAMRHLLWLSERLENPTTFRLALAWNAGLATANHAARVTAAQANYAQRVNNLYEN